MEFHAVTEESLARAAVILRGGGLAAFPTETVYGLGGDAFNPGALAKIFEAKARPHFDPLIVHIAALETLEKIADFSLLTDAEQKRLAVLAEKLWPGPLTLVLPKRSAVPDLATSGLATVAVRFPAHEAAQKLIARSTGALAAPSANPFGYISPTTAEHVRDQLGEKVDIILDGGPAAVGVESTVLDIRGQPRILRPGGTPKEAIEAFIGPVLSAASGIPDGSANSGGGDASFGSGLASPGQLKSHYAPRTPLSVFPFDAPPASLPDEKNAALLFFDAVSRNAWFTSRQDVTQPAEIQKNAIVRVLSEDGDMLEAAAALFRTLHELDKSGVTRIFAQLAPEHGLGTAINDRLRRAEAV